MNKKDCKIVQDLLPNYIDRLTNEETNEFVENHLQECKECKEVLENMSKNLNIEDKKKDKKIINFIKKYNKKMRVLKIIILLIVAIYLFSILRNAVIILSLINKSKNQEITSSYSINYEIVTTYGGISDMSSIVIEDVYLRTHNFLFLDGRKTNIVEYCEGDTSEYYIEKSNGKKIAMLNHEKGGVFALKPEECLLGRSESIKSLIRNIFKSSIIKVKDEYVLDNDRYYISNYEWSNYGPCDIYVNIKTGEICKVIKINSSSLDGIFTGDVTIDINFNNDKHTPYYELPNIEEYEIVEQ